MADPNVDAQELAEILRQVNDDLRQFGYITSDTAAAMAAGSRRNAQELERAGEITVDALEGLTRSVGSATRAMYQGQKGAAAFNDAISQASGAVVAAVGVFMLLAPQGKIGKALGALGVGAKEAAVGMRILAGGAIVGAALVKGLSELQQAAATLADNLYRGYAGLAKSGAVASDGLTGLFEDAKKLGFSMSELDSMVAIIGQNATDLSLFGGGVATGRKRLAEMGDQLRNNREYFLRLGYEMNDVTETMVGYVKQQRVAGDLNKQTAEQLAAGARRYLDEQDALTKLTGMARQEQERAREQVRSQERFAAQLETLRAQGRKDEAKALEDTYLILLSQSKDAAQGFADIQTGNVQTEAAQKGLMASQGESMRVAQQIVAGQVDAVNGAQRIAKAYGDTATRLGPSMGMIGTFDQTFGSLADSFKLRTMAENDIVKVLEKIESDRAKLASKEGAGVDNTLKDQAKLRKTQIEANEVLERFVKDAMPDATAVTIQFAEAIRDGTQSLHELFNESGPPRGRPQERVEGGQRAGSAQQVRPSQLGQMIGEFGDRQRYGKSEADLVRERTLQQRRRQAEEFAPPPVRPRAGAAPGGGPSLGGGGAPLGMTAEEGVAKFGLKINTADLSRQDAKYHPKFFETAAAIQAALGTNFGGFSGFNDMYHSGGAHSEGKALDFVLANTPRSEKETQEIVKALSSISGVKNVRDEYFHPSRNATGLHMHVELDLPAMAKGGITDGISIAGEAGPEAVVPLPDGRAIPVDAPSVDILGTQVSELVDLMKTDAGQGLAMNFLRTLAPPQVSALLAAKDMVVNQSTTADKLLRTVALINPMTAKIIGLRDAVTEESTVLDKILDIAGILVPQIGIARQAFGFFKGMFGGNEALPAMAKGGVTSGVSLAGEAGPEAVVPLPDGKAIPVSISLRDAQALGRIGAHGENEYTGYNIGPISTDIEALKQIAGKLGAYDAATETITDPATWKEILNTGMLMNYDMAGAKFGTRMFGPEIGAELGTAIKDIMSEGDKDVATALKEVKDQFKQAMDMVVNAMKDKDYETQQRMLETLQNIAQSQNRTADASQRLVRAAAN